MNLDAYWEDYAATLAAVRSLQPTTFAELKAILDRFESPSSGDAFFPSGAADDTLAAALRDAGWRIEFIEGYYVYKARSPIGATFEHFEGDLYEVSA